jgi:hypothetical protein
MWFEKHGVLLDYKGRRMIWPDEPTLFESVACRMPTPLPISILKRKTLIDPAHQVDADRRDQLLQGSVRLDLKRRQARSVRQEVVEQGALPMETVFQPKKRVFEIAMIGGTGFSRRRAVKGGVVNVSRRAARFFAMSPTS